LEAAVLVKKKISIVLPCFNEEGNIQILVETLTRLPLSHVDTEIIFVDDGSSDRTWEAIKKASSADARVRGVRLARNFGHQPALLAGLSVARGEAIISLDGDMQHPPELIVRMLDLWADGAEVVTTTRKFDERLPFVKKITSPLFYKTFSLLTGLDIQPGQADFRLLDRKVLDTVLSCGEKFFFIRGMISWVGYRRVDLEYTPNERHAGESKYNLRRMLRFAADGIFSFSVLPIRFSLITGCLVLSFCLLYALYAVTVHFGLFPGASDAIPGWASLVVIICSMFGMLFVQLGIIGEYIGRIYSEVKGRPRFIVSEQCSSEVTFREACEIKESTS